LKWFRKREMGKSISAAGLKMAAGALALGAVGLTASASLVIWQNPGFLLGQATELPAGWRMPNPARVWRRRFTG
jgi:hypothetical protein